MQINGIDLDKKAIYSVTDVKGSHKVDFLKIINQKAGQVFADNLEAYQAAVGKAQDFNFDFVNSDVIQYYNPIFLEDAPLRIADTVQVDLAQNVTLDKAISSSSESWMIFINGAACYEGAGNGTTMTPFTSTVPDAERSNGFIFIAAFPTNINVMPLVTDRVKLTFQLIGGGTLDVWLSLPIERDLDPEDLLFFDYYGACYKNATFNKVNFLSSFSIWEAERFNQGAIVNELYALRGCGQQAARFMDVGNADDYDLDYLGNKWFGVIRRAGEPNENYRLRIISSVVGEKTTPYGLRQILLKFSPNLVIIQEGIRGFGYYNRSFYSFPSELIATGVYTDFVAPAFYGSIAGGLLRIRIAIESNVVTNDPINARFIYELIRDAVMEGVQFEIQKV